MVGKIYRWIDPGFHDGPLLTVLIKLPGMIAELIFVVACSRGDAACLVTPRSGRPQRFGSSPAVWLSGAVDGYLDAQMAVPAALALLAAIDRRPRLAGVLVAVAVLTKPQALFVLPMIAHSCWPGARADRKWSRRFSRRRLSAFSRLVCRTSSPAPGRVYCARCSGLASTMSCPARRRIFGGS
jgi:hypothetical protein